jgi:hypothetical protein
MRHCADTRSASNEGHALKPARTTIWSVLAAGGLLVCAAPASLLIAAPAGPAEYRNERYGFSLEYPAGVFTLERSSAAGDGVVFVAGGDARLLVGALVNDRRYTPAAYQEHIARQSYGSYRLDYRRLGDTWFVLSGEGDGRIFYEKVMFSCAGRLINSFALFYPATRRDEFDPIVERIEKTFRPGSNCASAGLPPAPRKAKQAAARPDRRLPVGERSELADRIARQRGEDVIVILRRTTPPYDRRMVRGYVSPP